MTTRDYNRIADQLADTMLDNVGDGMGAAKLNLHGAARLHDWVQVGAGSASALSTLAGEPVVVRVIVQLERPNCEQP